MISDLQKTQDLPIVPSIVLLGLPLLDSPIHGGGLHVMVLRGMSDGRCWLLNGRWMEAETRQS